MTLLVVSFIFLILKLKWHSSCPKGPLEHSILQTFTKGGNICWWLSRDDCPEAIWQFNFFFNKAFLCDPKEKGHAYHKRTTLVAHIQHDGINFSCAATHLGNSLISYYSLPTATTPVAGSIQKITVNGPDVWLTVKCQAPCPSNAYDPFILYPSFPAWVYSSSTLDHEDRIPIVFAGLVRSGLLTFRDMDRDLDRSTVTIKGKRPDWTGQDRSFRSVDRS